MKEDKEVLLYACLDAVDKEPLPPYILSDDHWYDLREDRQAVARRIRWAVERAKAGIRKRSSSGPILKTRLSTGFITAGMHMTTDMKCPV